MIAYGSDKKAYLISFADCHLFTLAAFNILSLSLTLDSFNIMCLREGFFLCCGN